MRSTLSPNVGEPKEIRRAEDSESQRFGELKIRRAVQLALSISRAFLASDFIHFPLSTFCNRCVFEIVFPWRLCFAFAFAFAWVTLLCFLSVLLTWRRADNRA